MYWHPSKIKQIIQSQTSMISSKITKKALVTDLKEMKIHELINNGLKAVTFSLTYTDICYGGYGQSWCQWFSGPSKETKYPKPWRQGVTLQNMNSFSTLPSLTKQLPRTNPTFPNTWQTDTVLPHELIASLRYPPVYLGRSFESMLRSVCLSVRLERFHRRIWMSWRRQWFRQMK